MGCASSSQTSAVDTTRPIAKPEESNGASTTGVANENGNMAEDSETIPDQTPAEGSDAKPDSEPAAATTCGDGNSAKPPAGEESQPPAETPAAVTPAAETPAAETPETATSSSEAAAPEPVRGRQSVQIGGNLSGLVPPGQETMETKAAEAPAPSE